MSVLTDALSPEGAMVDLRIGWSTARIKGLRARHSPIPQPVEVRAIIDTGDEVSALDTQVVRSLNLPIGGFTATNMPALGGMNITMDHDVNLTILAPNGSGQGNLLIPDLLILDLDLGAVGYQALLGRDVLVRCRFLYDGQAGQFTLEY